MEATNMSQVPVKYVDPDCLFQTKGLNTTVIPVIELSALREVVEGLKAIANADWSHELNEAYLLAKKNEQVGARTPNEWLAQRLLASLGENK